MGDGLETLVTVNLGINRTALQISAGERHTCAVLVSGPSEILSVCVCVYVCVCGGGGVLLGWVCVGVGVCERARAVSSVIIRDFLHQTSIAL